MSYICQNCGAKSLTWAGKCSVCGEWGTLEEDESDNSLSPKQKIQASKKVKSAGFIKLSDTKTDNKSNRKSTNISELDRVLGGGIVEGSVILLGGEPGVGKSTLLAQVSVSMSSNDEIIYASGEESVSQVSRRFHRIGGYYSDRVLLTDERCVESIIKLSQDRHPALLIIDSVQTVVSNQSESLPGSVTQIKLCGNILTTFAKESKVPVIITGQITKQGAIAGPKVLEHVVDVVLNMSGDNRGQYRLLKSFKNRFGPTDEIGVFEMTPKGLLAIDDSSIAFVDQNHTDTVGCAIGATVSGSRIMLFEVQSLTVEKKYEGVPVRRVADGFKKNRLDVLSAVLMRKGNVNMFNYDLFLNIAGGFNVTEPEADLAVCASVKSAVMDRPLSTKIIYVGEVGLTGDIRSVRHVEKLMKNIVRLGFDAIVGNISLRSSRKIKIVNVKHIKELLKD